jgi:16S rRNA (guanine1207-N2)-methyltransferase
MKRGRGGRGARVGAQVAPPNPGHRPLAPGAWRTVTFGGQTIAIPDEPLCDADADDPANRLLADYAALHPSDRVLVLGAGCGLLAAWAAAQVAPGRLIISDTHSAALNRAAATLRHNNRTGYDLLPAERVAELEAGGLDAALVNSAFQSSSKALAELLRAAGRALKLGGMLYVAGAKAQGIGAIKTRMTEIFGAASTLAYRKGVHVVAAARPEHWAAETTAAPCETISVTVRGHSFHASLRDGVFARGGLDDGTRMLLEAVEVRPNDRALDLGCGSGIIGMLLARLAPAGHVDLVDSDSAAVALARDNLITNVIANATASVGDRIGAAPGTAYDLIATNPPFHLGRRQTTAIARAFIADAARALRPAGRFYLVANRFLPYEPNIEAAFGNVREVAGDGRYKVLLATRDA